eukprot:gene21390-24266_t
MDEQVENLWGRSQVMLGPMVRASSLPLRLAALDFGADVVYSEEIPAYRANPNTCFRHVNDVIGTVDFIEGKYAGKETLVLFRTHQAREVEERRCVLQLGTSDAVSALKAATLFERDVAAIDINMGCAKHYSVSRGMGAAHMTNPVVAEDIIKTLRRNLNIPISVKTRLQSTNCSANSCTHSNNSNDSSNTAVDTNASLEWLRRLQSAGANAVTLHMRTPTEKNRDAAHLDLFAMFYHSMKLTNTPLVYNGDIWSKAEADRVHRSVNATTSPGCNEHSPIEHKVPIMICRPALWNPSVFAQFKNRNLIQEESNTGLCTKDTPSSILIHDVLSCILKHSAATAHCPLNTRYLLQQILAGAKMLSSDTRAEVVKCYNLVSLSTVLGCKQFVQGEKRTQRTLWDAKRSQDALSQSSNGEVAIDKGLSRYCNSAMWPGIVCHTSHEYNDKYFDDNYYVAFSKPNNTVTDTASDMHTQSKEPTVTVPTKRPFAYSGFSESSSTVVRVKKAAL